MNWLIIGTLLATASIGSIAQAKDSSQKKVKLRKPIAADITPGKLETSMKFEETSVRGKYQTAGDILALVENEKDLDDLLGVRRHFKDRLKQDLNRK